MEATIGDSIIKSITDEILLEFNLDRSLSVDADTIKEKVNERLAMYSATQDAIIKREEEKEVQDTQKRAELDEDDVESLFFDKQDEQDEDDFPSDVKNFNLSGNFVGGLEGMNAREQNESNEYIEQLDEDQSTMSDGFPDAVKSLEDLDNESTTNELPVEETEEDPNLIKDFPSIYKKQLNGIKKSWGVLGDVIKFGGSPVEKILIIVALFLPALAGVVVTLLYLLILYIFWAIGFVLAMFNTKTSKIGDSLRMSTKSWWGKIKNGFKSGNFFKMLMSIAGISVVLINGIMYCFVKGMLIPMQGLQDLNKILANLTAKVTEYTRIALRGPAQLVTRMSSKMSLNAMRAAQANGLAQGAKGKVAVKGKQIGLTKEQLLARQNAQLKKQLAAKAKANAVMKKQEQLKQQQKVTNQARAKVNVDRKKDAVKKLEVIEKEKAKITENIVKNVAEKALEMKVKEIMATQKSAQAEVSKTSNVATPNTNDAKQNNSISSSGKSSNNDNSIANQIANSIVNSLSEKREATNKTPIKTDRIDDKPAKTETKPEITTKDERSSFKGVEEAKNVISSGEKEGDRQIQNLSEKLNSDPKFAGLSPEAKTNMVSAIEKMDDITSSSQLREAKLDLYREMESSGASREAMIEMACDIAQRRASDTDVERGEAMKNWCEQNPGLKDNELAYKTEELRLAEKEYQEQKARSDRDYGKVGPYLNEEAQALGYKNMNDLISNCPEEERNKTIAEITKNVVTKHGSEFEKESDKQNGISPDVRAARMADSLILVNEANIDRQRLQSEVKQAEKEKGNNRSQVDQLKERNRSDESRNQPRFIQPTSMSNSGSGGGGRGVS